MARQGKACQGMTWNVMTRHGMIWKDKARQGKACNGKAWNDMARKGMEWKGME
jgi:hypothetical protein